MAAATLLFAWIAAPGCAADPGGRAGPPRAGAAEQRPARGDGDARRAEVTLPGGRRILAEIADTPERTARGYMFRRHVGEEEGMVFVFPEPGPHPFWMKNTLVPLDIIWMDDEFKVIHIEPSAPPCEADPCPSYGPLRVARYVLEVKAGTVKRERIEVGQRMAISIPEPD